MARPTKSGLDYFPLDVDIFEDEKIEAIAGEFGSKGELAIIKLLCAVYKKGYFVVWNDLTRATLLKRLPGVSKELLEQIVNRLVTWGFFDEDLFNSAKVLTSENIQANFFEATKRRKSPKPTAYLINANNNTQVTGVNADINPQSKVKESRVNKSKENNYVFGVFDFLEKNQFGNPYSEPMATDISEWVKTLRNKGLSDQTIDEWMILGAKKAAGSNKRFWNYVNGTLRNWDNVGVYTEEEIENQKRDKSNNHNPKNRKQATDYGQTLYTYYEKEQQFSPNMTFDEYVAKKRLNERDRQALEQYIHSLEER